MTTVEDVRKELEGITPFEHDITILAQQAGMGKSSWARDYCNKHPEISNIGIISKRHNFLKECENEISDFSHWEGLERSCQNPKLKWYKELGLLKMGIICPSCSKKKNCKYYNQFEKKHRVGAPTEYLDEKYLHGFNLLLIEEKITETNRYFYDSTSLENGLQAMIEEKSYQYQTDFLERFNEAVKNNDVEYLYSFLSKIRIIKFNYIRHALKEKNMNLLKGINNVDLELLEGYLKYGKIHNFDREEYYEPQIFKAFDLAKKGSKVVLLHAGFDQLLFLRLLERYDSEFGRSGLTYKIYTSDVKNLETDCFKITEKSFGKSNFDKFYRKWVEDFLIKIIKIYNIEDIYILTYKNLCHPNLPKGKNAQLAFGLDSMNFGNTSGLNNFENKKVLVIIGTYSLPVRDMVKKHNELFNDNLKPDDFERIAEKHVKEHKYPDFRKTELEVIQRAEEDNELYDAIHRNRGLLSPKKIYVLGNVPPKIKDEFNYRPVNEDEIEDLLIEEHDPCIYHNIDFYNIIELIKHEKSNTKIARKLNIRINGNYDTKLIKHIRAYITQEKLKL